MKLFYRSGGSFEQRCSLMKALSHHAGCGCRNCYRVPTASPRIPVAAVTHDRRNCGHFIPVTTGLHPDQRKGEGMPLFFLKGFVLDFGLVASQGRSPRGVRAESLAAKPGSRNHSVPPAAVAAALVRQLRGPARELAPHGAEPLTSPTHLASTKMGMPSHDHALRRADDTEQPSKVAPQAEGANPETLPANAERPRHNFLVFYPVPCHL